MSLAITKLFVETIVFHSQLSLFLLLSRFLRSVAYRQVVRFIWDYMGCSKRIPLPSCIYHAIRAEFPSDNGDYHGFQEEELEE